MKAFEALAVVLLIALAVSIYFDFALYSSNQQLTSTVNNLNQSFNDLNQRYLTLNQSYAQMIDDIDHFNSQVNQNSTFLTPISKSQAISIALAYGGWNATSLRGQIVVANLDHVTYNSSADWYERVTVVEPVADYSRITDGPMESWYEWVIFIGNAGPYPFIHTGYYVDAVTGQILSVMGIS
jgi:hypothetical protein